MPEEWPLLVGFAITCLVGLAVIWYSVRLFLPVLLGVKQTAALLQSGAPATAKVISVKQNGLWVNDNPQVDIVLEVNSESPSAYQAKLTMVIPPIVAPQIQPGARLNIRVDANNRSNIVIDEPWMK
jgi:hypothetical protein